MSIQGKDILYFFKKYPVPAGCIALLVVVCLTFYVRSGQLAEATAMLDQRSAELKRYKANVAASAQLDTQLEILQKANAQFRQSSIYIGELAKNPQIFYSLEKETGVKMSNVKQLSTAAANGPADDFITVPFSVVADGDLTQLLVLLKKLEYGQQVIHISSASLNVGSGNKLSLSLTTEILGLR
jgi:hypothetical protein